MITMALIIHFFLIMRTCYANVLPTATFKECLNQQSYSLTGSQGKKKSVVSETCWKKLFH